MIANILNTMNTIFQNPQVTQTASPQRLDKNQIENPFASPFITVPSKRQTMGGKNQPIQGGYFAGYHNGKQNIVGKKLFITV